MREQLYELHPLFEFYITSYFLFIIAPETINDIVSKSIGRYYLRGKIILIKNLLTHRRKFNHCSLALTKVWFGDDYVLYKNELRIRMLSTINEINSEIQRIRSTKLINNADSIIASRIVTKFESIFLFSGLYAFFILLCNGCEVLKEIEHSDGFILSLSFFNFLSFLFLIFLLYKDEYIKRRKIRKNFKSFKRVTYKNWYSMVVFIVLIFLTFVLNILPKEFNKIKHASDWTVGLTVAIGLLPMIWYGVQLNACMRYYFRKDYKRELKLFEAKYNTFEGLSVLSKVKI